MNNQEKNWKGAERKIRRIICEAFEDGRWLYSYKIKDHVSKTMKIIRQLVKKEKEKWQKELNEKNKEKGGEIK